MDGIAAMRDPNSLNDHVMVSAMYMFDFGETSLSRVWTVIYHNDKNVSIVARRIFFINLIGIIFSRLKGIISLAIMLHFHMIMAIAMDWCLCRSVGDITSI